MLFLGGGLRKAAPLLGIESLNVLYFPNSEATPIRANVATGPLMRTSDGIADTLRSISARQPVLTRSCSASFPA